MAVALCIRDRHDPLLVALALLVCLLGSASTVHLFSRIGRAQGQTKAGWVVLTSVASGCMVWCTHFIGMLAYRPQVVVVLDPLLTLLSLAIAVVVTSAGLVIANRSSQRTHALLGGGVIGLAIAGMHYTGMAAYHVHGVMVWSTGYVLASIAMSIGFSALAVNVIRLGGSRWRRAGGALLLGVAVATLHFTGMAALTVVPLTLGEGQGLSTGSMTAIAICTAMGGMLVIGCAAVSAIIDDNNQSETFRRMRHMALHDNLTGLPNRMAFQRLLLDKVGDCEEYGGDGGELAVVMIDMTGFKQINDTFGHQAGDQVLVAMAERLNRTIIGDEAAARLGGDEFALLKAFRHRSELDGFLRRIEAVFDAPYVFERFASRCPASIGVAVAPGDGSVPDLLLANADLAMYRAKADRSAAACFYSADMDAAARQRRELGQQLRAAVGSDQFHIAYQVQASLIDGRVNAYEALARWDRPGQGSVPPAVFIPLAEEVGEIGRLGERILRESCTEAAGWREQHLLSVNLSPIQLSDPLLVEKVRQALADSRLPAERLELELTESAIMKDRDNALAKLRQIKRLGVQIALDDFGTGYSSLEVLRSFPFDKLKLDASFVSEVETSGQAVAILRSVAALGRTLGLPVTAEGIESAAQLAIVRAEGCSGGQGFLLGRPGKLLSAAEEARMRALITKTVRPLGLAA